jgi:hypothetical protein
MCQARIVAAGVARILQAHTTCYNLAHLRGFQHRIIIRSHHDMSNPARSEGGGGARPTPPSTLPKNPSEKNLASAVNHDAVGRCVRMEGREGGELKQAFA